MSTKSLPVLRYARESIRALRGGWHYSRDGHRRAQGREGLSAPSQTPDKGADALRRREADRVYPFRRGVSTVMPIRRRLADSTSLGQDVNAAEVVSHVFELALPVLATREFDLRLRLDTDALIIGGELEELARRGFAKQPGRRILGSYRCGPDGNERDWECLVASALVAERGFRGLHLSRLRRLGASQRPRGRRGARLDGPDLMSSASVHSLAERGWPDPKALRTIHSGEDRLAGLPDRAAHYDGGDLGAPDDLTALRWKEQPAPAAEPELLTQGKLVVHSVRSSPEHVEAANWAAFAAAHKRGPV